MIFSELTAAIRMSKGNAAATFGQTFAKIVDAPHGRHDPDFVSDADTTVLAPIGQDLGNFALKRRKRLSCAFYRLIFIFKNIRKIGLNVVNMNVASRGDIHSRVTDGHAILNDAFSGFDILKRVLVPVFTDLDIILGINYHLQARSFR
jgi:hypothetical protein